MLYKYVRPERLDIIKGLEVRFTPANALNDPFELRPRFEALVAEADLLANLSSTPIDFDPILRQAYGMLAPEQRALLPFEDAAGAFRSFMETDQGRSAVSEGLSWFLGFNVDAAVHLRESLYEALNRGVGILSLSEIPDDPLMWAHYGDSHRGFVIGFNEKHSFFCRRRSENDEFYFLRKVVYADLPPATSILGVEGNSLFITKGTKWSYEREWRMLAPLEDSSRSIEVGGESVQLFAVPPEILKSVVFGARASAELECSVRDALGTNANLSHVLLSRATLDMDSQQVQVRSCAR